MKLARDDNGTVAGMIHYIPVELSFVEGKDLYFINCIWVHGHKQGRGNFQKKGLGKELLKAAEEDAESLGRQGTCGLGFSPALFHERLLVQKARLPPGRQNGNASPAMEALHRRCRAPQVDPPEKETRSPSPAK